MQIKTVAHRLFVDDLKFRCLENVAHLFPAVYFKIAQVLIFSLKRGFTHEFSYQTILS
jgi:hypothetical protein